MRFFSTVLASTLGGLIALAVFVVFLLTIFAGIAAIETGRPMIREGTVLSVRLHGSVPEIPEMAPMEIVFGGKSGISLRELTAAIRSAAEDDRVEGMLIIPESPGGSWAALEEIRDAILDFRSTGKPTVATSTAEGFSERDYFVASAAERIYSTELATFEMNGFALIAQFVKGLMDKVGVQAEAVRAGRFKSAVEPFTREHASDENLTQLQTLVDSQSETFLNALAHSRAIEFQRLQEIVRFTSVTNAEEALAEGFLDGLLTEDEAADLFADSLLSGSSEPTFVDIAEYARSTPASSSTSSKNVVAIVYAVGTIVEGGGGYDPDPLFGGRRAGSTELLDALENVRDNERVKAVVLRIDSPGGSGRASDVIYRAVEQTAAAKPVIASFGSIAASGGYFIAAGADSIVANATSVTGSIGVFSLVVNASGLMNDKLGITFDAVKTGPTADMFSGLRALTEFERKILERGVDRMYNRFTQVVADGRNMQMTEVLSLAEGRVWSGSDGVGNGLVDRIGTLDDAVEMAARAAGIDSAGYVIRTYPREKSLFERLLKFAETAESHVLGDAFDNAVGSPAMRQIRLLHELEQLHGTVQARMPVSFSIE